MAPRAGVEPATPRLGGGCSIRLSYRGLGRIVTDRVDLDVFRSLNMRMHIKRILEETKTIAVVGLSNNPTKASFAVAKYLMPFYRVIPVNPEYDEVLGLRCYPDLQSIPEKVDMVDLFQRSENVMPFVRPSIDIGARYFWMQMGIRSARARADLEAEGIEVVEDLCLKVEHARFL